MKKIFVTLTFLLVTFVSFSAVTIGIRPIGSTGSYMGVCDDYCLTPNTEYEVAVILTKSDYQKGCACIVNVYGATLIGTSCKDTQSVLGIMKVATFTVKTNSSSSEFSITGRSGCNSSSSSPSSSFGNYGSVNFNICNYN